MRGGLGYLTEITNQNTMRHFSFIEMRVLNLSYDADGFFLRLDRACRLTTAQNAVDAAS